ncbi:ABC-2 type transport system ATP-binding protein [Leucobacter exalbidus]|uniref:ABC-2 type transport system ATP-binding protein n=1 Tax=Leucobacter exalbidus TaxID=662960 RepID=A0A940PRL1_9MICO|nr:ABC transporter ATP-binding protein [Leucobacter exalbidus]MBP1324950.1 ABC-2 type transport system ATP-binding protein [Leucobacter exalbidus]
MIEARGLTKQYGDKRAVDDVTFSIAPGQVTGFLGPNGAGKSTTMRLILGLDKASSGTVTVNGMRYSEMASPLTQVGALLDAKGVHPGRTARSHLRAIAATHGISDRRVNDVLEQTGLESVAHKRVGGYSLGMGQRLGIAAALLGDPGVLILDEPVNGLDPDGVRWIRELLRFLASEGRTVLLSSHLMTEMAQTADHIIVLARGQVKADAPLAEFLDVQGKRMVTVRSPESARLASLIMREIPGCRLDSSGDAGFTAQGIETAQVGRIALNAGIELHELASSGSNLEDAYLSLTQDDVEYTTERYAA